MPDMLDASIFTD